MMFVRGNVKQFRPELRCKDPSQMQPLPTTCAFLRPCNFSSLIIV
jgi:hypothetical protein